MAASRASPPVPRTVAPPAHAAQFLPPRRGPRAGGTPRSPPRSSNRRVRPPEIQIRLCDGSPASPARSCSKFLVPARVPHLRTAPATQRQASALASSPFRFRPIKSSSRAAARETTHPEKYRLRGSLCEHPRIGWLVRYRRELLRDLSSHAPLLITWFL